MRDFRTENLCHDPIHGYIPFVSDVGLAPQEIAERQIIDHPWVQRMRQIHQLQTAWWVFPSAEHTRFQHVIGAMHLASRAVATLYDSLQEVCPDVPSRGYIESLARMGALLHDVGHGPFGHFFDEHFLSDFDLTHETLGAKIIEQELGPLLRRIRRNPNTRLADHETLDPAEVAFLIVRPGKTIHRSTASPAATTEDAQPVGPPRWLELLRSLFCGIYTVDNMDFVLRDAFMSGYSTQAFDLDRLLRYSFFSPSGLTIHTKGVPALVRFIGVKAELFRTIYFHRTVRSIDLSLADLFADSKQFLFPGDPLKNLSAYQRFTEFSLLVDVTRWPDSSDERQRELGKRWLAIIHREVPWKTAVERRLVFGASDAERSSIFSDAKIVELKLRAELPAELASLPLRVDLARHIHRPHTRGPSSEQNFLYDPAHAEPRPLVDDQLYRQLPLIHRICRVYTTDDQYAPKIAKALEKILGPGGADDLTNM
jgi:HD superfamily phosphohydrolase